MTELGFVSAPAGVRGQKPLVDDGEKGCSRRMQTDRRTDRRGIRARERWLAGRGVQADSVGGP